MSKQKPKTKRYGNEWWCKAMAKFDDPDRSWYRFGFSGRVFEQKVGNAYDMIERYGGSIVSCDIPISVPTYAHSVAGIRKIAGGCVMNYRDIDYKGVKPEKLVDGRMYRVKSGDPITFKGRFVGHWEDEINNRWYYFFEMANGTPIAIIAKYTAIFNTK